jgi:hypothetical protein
MTTKDLKLNVYHYQDEKKRAIIINKAQMVVCVLSKGVYGGPITTEAALTEDLTWKPQEGNTYSIMQKKMIDSVLVNFQKNPVYRYTCEQGEVDRLQEKIDKRLQEIADMEREIKRIQGK